MARAAAGLVRRPARPRPRTADLYRRNRGHDQDGAARGRAPRGERCRAAIPHGHWKTTTFTGALTPARHDRTDGPRRPHERPCVPRLRRAGARTHAPPGDVVIMDNLPAHKVAGSRLPSRPPAPGCACCRPTAPTSTRSRLAFASSRRCSERPQPAPSLSSGTPSATPCRSSAHRVRQLLLRVWV